jgi:hypothetical protein
MPGDTAHDAKPAIVALDDVVTLDQRQQIGHLPRLARQWLAVQHRQRRSAAASRNFVCACATPIAMPAL